MEGMIREGRSELGSSPASPDRDRRKDSHLWRCLAEAGIGGGEEVGKDKLQPP